MIGIFKMISKKIQRTNKTLEERGIPSDSFFSLVFEDGSEISERETTWGFLCEKKEVDYLGGRKIVNFSKFPVKEIRCSFEGLEAKIEVPNGCQVYQSIRSETLIIPNSQRKDRIIGRIIGIIKDGEVIEEQFLNGLQFKIEGFRK